MGVSLGIGALAEGAGAAAADFALPAAITSGVEAGIADVGLGTLAADAAGAGALATATDFALPEATMAGIEAGISGAAPELAAPIATGAAEGLGTTAGALAPAGGALAPAVSPAVTGLSTVAEGAVPSALAEGAGVTPLTETALDFSLPASTEAGVNAGIEEATAQGATQAATQGAEQLGTQAAKQIAGDGLSQLAPGAQQVLNDAGPLSYEAGSQLAQAAPQAAAPPTAPPVEAPSAAPPTSTAPPAVQPMNPPAPTTPPVAAPSPVTPTPNALAPQAAGTIAPSITGANFELPAGVTSGVNAGIEASGAAGGEGLLGSASNLAGKAGTWLANNPMSVLSGAGMAYNLMKGQQPPRYSAELQAQSAALQAQGAQLQGYLTSGTLPPGIGAALSGAHDSAAAAIRSRYANTGMSGSSAEMQDLNNLAQTTVSQGADIANKLLATGVSEQQFASGLYQNLMATAMQQDTNMSKAISDFTGALARSSVQPKPV